MLAANEKSVFEWIVKWEMVAEGMERRGYYCVDTAVDDSLCFVG